MRYLYVVAAIIFMFGTAVIAEENISDDKSSGTVKVSADKGKGEPLSDEQEYGEDNRREMPQQQSYDENTGLPNNVPSDREGEI